MSEIEKFLKKIIINQNDCWVWIASKTHDGYGQFCIPNKKIYRAHRFIFEYYYGQICPDLTIDHLCRNRACVNPLHLEQVTIKVNVLRGNTITALNHQKTHCIHGHEFTPENTTIRKDGRRNCKICRHENQIRCRQKESIKQIEVD